jgi:hypothetical protein
LKLYPTKTIAFDYAGQPFRVAYLKPGKGFIIPAISTVIQYQLKFRKLFQIKGFRQAGGRKPSKHTGRF